MRSKVLILFFLIWTFHSLSFAQVIPPRFDRESTTDSVGFDTKEKRTAQMEKLYRSVPVDTTDYKVVSLQPDFQQKYADDPEFRYDPEKGSKTFLARLLEKLGELLKKLLGLGSLSKVTDTTVLVFKILCGLVVLVALYLIVRLAMNHQGKWFFQNKNESIAIDINNTEQLIQSADFEQLIYEIEKQGDTRQSIRLYYLWLLKVLKDKELIKWLPEKTNSDYLSELRDERLREKFIYLSYLFNNIWYGEFSITDADYVNARKAFLNYLKGGSQNG